MKKLPLLKKITFLFTIIGLNILTAQTYTFSQPDPDPNDDYVEGFIIHTEFSTIQQATAANTDGVMIFTMPDPSDLIPTSMRVDQSGVINATNNKFLTVRLQNNTDVTNLRLKIQNSPAKWTVPIVLETNNSEFKTYTLEIKNPEWTGDLSNIFFQFRIPGRQMPITGTSIVIDEVSFTPTLSVNDVNKEDTNIKLYPNPAKETLTINSNSQKNVSEIQIYNILGKEILSITNSNVINVSTLSKGVYVIRILEEGNTLASTKKFLKE